MNNYMNNFQPEKSMDGNTPQKAVPWVGAHQRRPWMGTTPPEKSMHRCMVGTHQRRHWTGTIIIWLRKVLIKERAQRTP